MKKKVAGLTLTRKEDDPTKPFLLQFSQHPNTTHHREFTTNFLKPNRKIKRVMQIP
jgi:hypothetical protein